MVGCEEAVIQLQVKDWKGLASFGDFCITATFQGSSQETRRCLEARRARRLPLLFLWKQSRQRLGRARSAHVRVEVAAEAGQGPKLAFLHISLKEAQDMLAAPDKPESHSWRPLVGGGRGAELLVGAFFRPASACRLQPHSSAESQTTPAHSRPHSSKSAVDFIWDTNNQFFRMEPPSLRDELYRFAACVLEAHDLDLLVLGHGGCGGGLRLELSLAGGFPALTAGTLASALAAPSADDRSALCFRGSVGAFWQAACAEPARLRLVDGRGNCIGHANFPLGALLSGQQFQDFSSGDGSRDLFEAEHELTMACDARGSVPSGADGSRPTVRLAASLRRVPPSEWVRRGQLATSVLCPDTTGRRSSSYASPAHYSPASTSRSQGLAALCCEQAADPLEGLTLSGTEKPDSISKSFPSLPTGNSWDQSTDHCSSHPGTPPEHSSAEETPGEQSSRSYASRDRSRSFPDIVPDEPAPPSTTTLASGANGQSGTCLTDDMHSPASDSETRFILEHVPCLDLSDGVSKRALSIHSDSLTSLLDLSPASCQSPKCERKLPVNQVANPRSVSIKNSSDMVSIASPLINSSEAVEKESASTVPRLLLDTDCIANGRKTAKDPHGKKLVRSNSDVVRSLSSADKLASPLLSDAESGTSIEMNQPPSSADDRMRFHSPPPLSKCPTDSQYWAVKRKKRDRRRKSSDRVATKTDFQITQDKSLIKGRCKFENHLDTSRKMDLKESNKSVDKKSSPILSPREELDYTEKLTTRYHKGKSSHFMYRARYTVTKIIVFDESLCGILFVGFQHQQLEEQNVLTKVVIKDPDEMVAPPGVVGTVKMCSLRGHMLEQVSALPPTLNVSHHKVRCDPHLVQAELSFVVAEPGMFALYRVATGEVVGTVHADLRILGPYRCPASVCSQVGSACVPYMDEELTEDETQTFREHEIRGDGNCGTLLESERVGETEKDAWREREMEVLATVNDMYADVCQMTEETKILQGREEWLDPKVRRVWMWRLESLEARYEKACQQYRELYSIRK